MAGTGEHADKMEWPICAHRTPEGAEVKRRMLEIWAELHSVDWDHCHTAPADYDRIQHAREAWKAKWPDYPIRIDYNGLAFETVAMEYDPDEQIPGDGAV